MPTPYYGIQVEFDVVCENDFNPNTVAAVCEDATGHNAKTWGFIDKARRFRVMFLTKCVTEARYIRNVLAASKSVGQEGRIEVMFVEQPTNYMHPPYLYRLGSKVVASCNVTCMFDKITFARMGTKGTVYAHYSPYTYLVLFENGEPDGKLVRTEVTELRVEEEVTPNVVIE